MHRVANIMQNAFQTFINWNTDQGPNDLKKIKVRLFNYLILALLVFQIFIFIKDVLTLDKVGAIIDSFVFLLTLSMVVLHRFTSFSITVICCNILYPSLICLINILLGGYDGLNYLFFIFMITAIIFHEHKWAKLGLISFNVLLFLFGQYYTSSFPAPFFMPKNPTDHIIFFILATCVITLIIVMFYAQILHYERSSQNLVKNLQQNNQELSRLNNELERFTHATSHDLRTPLRTVVSFTGLMERALENKEYDKLEEYFDYVKTGAKQMNTLLQTTLEYSNLESSQSGSEIVVLNDIIDAIKKEIGGNNITIIRTNLPKYKGNKSLIYKALQGIIENGIKYNTSHQKVIQISHHIDNHHLVLKIADNGIGIEPDYFEEIFSHFKRLHTQIQFEGTGLGLAICKKIIEQLRGEIWVESEVDKGSIFYIQLPLIELDETKTLPLIKEKWEILN